MASVAEIKAELTAELNKIPELYRDALSGIDTALSVAMWTSATSTVIVAIVAVFGWWGIRRASIQRSEQVAARAIQDYIKKIDIDDLVASAIQKDVLARKYIVVNNAVEPLDRELKAGQIFAADPKEG